MPYNSRASLERAIRQFIAEATGIPRADVIPGNDPNPSPSGLYATVLKITTAGKGIDNEVAYDDPADPTQVRLETTGYRIGLYSVQFYRAGADDAASLLLRYPATAAGQNALARLDLTWGRAYEVSLNDAVFASEWEERTAVRVEFKYRVQSTVSVNAIETASPLTVIQEQ